MADGEIRIKLKTETQEAEAAKKEIESLGKSAEEVSGKLDDVDGEGLDDVTKKAKEADGSVQKTDASVKKMTASLLLVKVAAKAFDILAKSLGDAVKRFDTMNQFPRVMEQLGHSTEASERSINKLARGIEGLPTRLDEVVSTAQRMAIVTGNIEKATDTTIALNNAMIANGSSSADAARGLEQYIQMLGNGEVDMQSWRSLNETMGVGLRKTAEAFGFAGDAAVNDLYSALKNGNITFDEFNSKLIELNDGVGGFADLARESSKGWATSWANIKSAVVRNVADMLGAFDQLVEALTGATVVENLDRLKGVVDSVFGAMKGTMAALIPVAKLLGMSFNLLVSIIKPMAPSLMGLVAAFVAMKSAMAIGGVLKTASAAITAFMAHAVAAAGSTNLLAIGITGLRMAFNALLGPVGWGMAAFGALVGVITTAISVYNDLPDSVRETIGAMEEAVSATDTLTDSFDSSAESAKANMSSIDSQANSLENLLNSTLELTKAENLSAGQKKIVSDNVEDLNNSLQGLNLTYDEETNKLSMNRQAIQERIDIMKQEQEVAELRRREVEISDELAQAQEMLIENERLLAEAKEEVNNIPWFKSSKEAEERVAELQASNEELRGSMSALGEENIAVSGQIEEASERLALSQENMTEVAITSLEQLEDTQKTVADALRASYQEVEQAATDMFQTINTESDLSVQEMIANLEHNINAVNDWATNLDTLANRGVNEGLLNHMRNMGPEGAGYVAQLATMSDAELQQLNSLFEQAGKDVPESFATAMGEAFQSMPDEVKNLITQTKTTLDDEITAAFPEVGENMVAKIMEGVEAGDLEAGPLVEKFTEAIEENQEEFVASGEQVPEYYSQGITENVEVVGEAADGIMEEVTTSLEEDESALESGAKVPEDIATGMTENTEVATGAAGEIMGEVETALGEGTEGVQEMGGDVIDGLAAGMDENAGTAEASAAEVGSAVSDAFAGELGIESPSTVFMAHGADIIAGTVQGITENTPTAVEAINSLATQMSEEMQNGLDSIKEVSTTSLQGVTQAITDMFTNSNSETTTGMSTLETTITTGFTSIDGEVTSRTGTILSTITSWFSDINSEATSSMNSFEQTIQDSWSQSERITTDAGNRIVQAVTQTMNDVVSESQRGTDDAVSAMGTGATGAYNAGYDMGMGFNNGLAATASSIYATASRIAANAVAMMRRALDSRSPSRKTMAVGEDTTEGLEIGMLSREDDVKRASVRLGEAAIPRVDTAALYNSLTPASSTNTVYNNQSFTVNAGQNVNGEMRPEDWRRLLKEMAYYMTQEGGDLGWNG